MQVTFLTPRLRCLTIGDSSHYSIIDAARWQRAQSLIVPPLAAWGATIAHCSGPSIKQSSITHKFNGFRIFCFISVTYGHCEVSPYDVLLFVLALLMKYVAWCTQPRLYFIILVTICYHDFICRIEQGCIEK